MSLYLVSCDLMHGKEFGAYEYYHAELRKFQGERVLESAWVLRSSLNAEAIRDALVKFIHQDDRILVAELSETNWAAWKALVDIPEA